MSNDELNTLGPLPELTLKFFNENTLIKGLRLLRNGSISISFQKGTLETYCIISGIVKDDSSYEAKLTYKKRLENSPKGPFQTSCNCYLWTENNHCPHTAGLFLHLINQLNHNEPSSLYEEDSEIPVFSYKGVNPEAFGTIIKAPAALIGSHLTNSYTGLQYVLTNNKIVNFPIPSPFNGKIILNINTNDKIPRPHFYHRREDGTIQKRISLFEHLYLFNWSDGSCISLPQPLGYLIRTFTFNYNTLSVNDFIQLSSEKDVIDFIDINIDNRPLKEVPKVTPQLIINLDKAPKSNYIDFSLSFVNQASGEPIPIPSFLSILTFTGGILSSFKSKNASYEFLNVLIQSINDGSNTFRKQLRNNNQKEKIERILNNVLNIENETTIIIHPGHSTIIEYQNSFLKEIVTALYNCFGETFFRFSQYDHSTNTIKFQTSHTSLVSGILEFHSTIKNHNNLSITYNKKQMAHWRSKISFERQESSLKWFDLNLNISSYDLNIINNTDINAGVTFTDEGLILLDEDHKKLLKFIKRYTQDEKAQIIKNTDKNVKSKESEEIDEKKLITQFHFKFNKSRIFELLELKKLGVDGALSAEDLSFCDKLLNLKSIPSYPISPELNKILRPYQKTGHHWLNFLYENKLGACLADDMGLGKTLQVISFIESVYDKIERILIVCPISILINWQQEIYRFSQMDSYIYHGGVRSFPDDTKIILTSYGIMKKEAYNFFSTINFDILVLDEVQHLKNIKSLGSRAVRLLNANFKISMTGTPVENDLIEFYNILDISIPGIWGDLSFVKNHSDKKTRAVAKKTSSPFILRRTKDQVLSDLPPKTENNIFLEMSEPEKSNYAKTLLEIKYKISQESSRHKYGQILKGLLKLRQQALWQNIDNEIISTKITFLIEQVKQIIEEGHQILIFSQFTTYLDIIQKHIKSNDWNFARIDGSQSIKTRQKQVELFQTGKTNLFLISLKAGGVGLNLTAASYVFIMDPWWNPAVENQAIDRAHRIGQKNKLSIYRPIIKGSVEEKVLELQKRKKELFNDLLNNEDDTFFTGRLTKDDFLHLLS